MVILCDGSAHLRRDLCDVRVVSGCATDGMIQRENAPMRSSGLLKSRLLEKKSLDALFSCLSSRDMYFKTSVFERSAWAGLIDSFHRTVTHSKYSSTKGPPTV